MWEAVFADVGVALLAILNAMRIVKIKLRQWVIRTQKSLSYPDDL